MEELGFANAEFAIMPQPTEWKTYWNDLGTSDYLNAIFLLKKNTFVVNIDVKYTNILFFWIFGRL